MRQIITTPLAAVALLALCLGAMASSPPLEATASILNSKNQPIGTAALTQMPEGVQIHIDATNLPPGATLAFHIHENGVCDAADSFKSAGAHFNPTHMEHGKKVPDGPHAGDMMNVKVSADGTLHTQIINPAFSLEFGQPNNILKPGGTALVLHAGPDDYTSQPSGNAGDRIACGVIKGE